MFVMARSANAPFGQTIRSVTLFGISRNLID